MRGTESGTLKGLPQSKLSIPTILEWEAALQEAELTKSKGDVGWTVLELCDVLGHGLCKIRQLIRIMIAQGVIICDPKGRQTTSVTGRAIRSPAYRIVKRNKELKNATRRGKKSNGPNSKKKKRKSAKRAKCR